MKHYFSLLALAASFVCQAHASSAEKFEVSESEIRTILLKKEYSFKDKGTYIIDGEIPGLEYELNNNTGIKGVISFDNTHPFTITLQCFAEDFEEKYKWISLDTAYSFSSEFAVDHIRYRSNYEGSGGSYYLVNKVLKKDEKGPILKEIGPLATFYNRHARSTLELSPLNYCDHPIFGRMLEFILPADTPNDTTQAAVAQVNSLSHMPKDIILKAVPAMGDRSTAFNIGLVNKYLYSIYLSEYVIGGPGAGVTRRSVVIDSLQSLLSGKRLNFVASNKEVGAFNFETNYTSLSIREEGMGELIVHGGAPASYQPATQEVLRVSTQHNKGWPFNSVAKVTFEENVYWASILGQEKFPNDPEKWDQPYAGGGRGSAIYTIEGKDEDGKEIYVSYTFYKPVL